MSYILELRKIVGNQSLINTGGRIIIENSCGEILLIHRLDFKMWGLPSGSIELGESAEQAMKREAFEETGLIVNELKLIGVSSDPSIETVRYPNGDVIQNMSLVFYSNDYTGTLLRRTDETSDARFFSVDNLPNIVQNESTSIAHFKEYKTNNLVFVK